MAKTMAKIEDGVVTNIVWCSDIEPETDTLKHTDDRPVTIGDTYENGKFYRDGVEILAPMVELRSEIAQLQETYSATQADTDAMLVDYEYRLTLLELGLTE